MRPLPAKGKAQEKGSGFNAIWTSCPKEPEDQGTLGAHQEGGLNQVGEGQDFIYDQREDPVYSPSYGQLGWAIGAIMDASLEVQDLCFELQSDLLVRVIQRQGHRGIIFGPEIVLWPGFE